MDCGNNSETMLVLDWAKCTCAPLLLSSGRTSHARLLVPPQKAGMAEFYAAHKCKAVRLLL